MATQSTEKGAGASAMLAIQKILQQASFKAVGMVTTAPDLRNFQGDKGTVHMMGFSIACGKQSVKYSIIGDDPSVFPNVQVGELVSVEVTSASTDKGAMTIKGDLTKLNLDEMF